MAEKYSFTKERIEYINNQMTERDTKTLKHFGYDKPIGEVNTTGDNKNPFRRIGHVIENLGIDTTHKTRITFDYDPDFTHCLLQINQSDELNNRAAN